MTTWLLLLSFCIVLITILLILHFLRNREVYEYYSDTKPKLLHRDWKLHKGRKNGEEHVYYRTGELNRTKMWINGVLNGASVVYFKTGQPYIESFYKNGKIVGMYTVFGLDGKIIEHRHYEK